MSDRFKIDWIDSGREPQCPPNPDFPNGIDVKLAGVFSGVPTCTVLLPYPARRCGHYMVKCKVCGVSVAITTAGRPDDPRSATIPCAQAKRSAH